MAGTSVRMVGMQVVALPKLVPVTLSDYGGEKFSNAEYLAFCWANPNLRLERTAEGEILIIPPAGLESSNRNSRVTAQLAAWAEEDGRGIVTDSSGQYFLADGSALSPRRRLGLKFCLAQCLSAEAKRVSAPVSGVRCGSDVA